MTASSLSWTLDQAVARVGGRLLGADGGFRGVGIDSRQDLSGRLFVALPGERHDGHDFAASARDQGASALMVQRPPVSYTHLRAHETALDPVCRLLLEQKTLK